MQALRAELRDFYDDYAECLDEDDLESWPSFFTEDARYTVTARENHDQGLDHATLYCDGIAMIRDRVLAIRKSTVFEPRTLRHVVSGVRVRAAGDVIDAKASFVIFESLSDKEPRILMVGRYLDRLVRAGNSFLFKERACVFDNYRIMTSLIIPV
jgi:anthranilate 1,2-dioxygenase small subunit